MNDLATPIHRWVPAVLGYPALAPLMMMELVRRFPQRPRGGTTAPRLLMRAAWADAGYCIDAPEVMPAGSLMSEMLPPFEDEPPEYAATQRTWNRE